MAYRGRTPINTHKDARYRAKLEKAVAAHVPDDMRVQLRRIVAQSYARAVKVSLASGYPVTHSDVMAGTKDAQALTVSHVEAQTDAVATLRLAHALCAAARIALWDAVEVVKSKLGDRDVIYPVDQWPKHFFDPALHLPSYWSAQELGNEVGALALRRALALAGKPMASIAAAKMTWDIFTKSMDRTAFVRTRFIHLYSDLELSICMERIKLPDVWLSHPAVGHAGGKTRRVIGMLAKANPDDERMQLLARMVRNRSIVNSRDLRRVAWKLGIERDLRVALDAQ